MGWHWTNALSGAAVTLATQRLVAYLVSNRAARRGSAGRSRHQSTIAGSSGACCSRQTAQRSEPSRPSSASIVPPQARQRLSAGQGSSTGNEAILGL
jgi:hypothetical protein